MPAAVTLDQICSELRRQIMDRSLPPGSKAFRADACADSGRSAGRPSGRPSDVSNPRD